MDIFTLRDNLKNTIEGKERYHENLVNEYLLTQHDADPFDPAATGIKMADQAAMKFLDLNIKELYDILADVEICCKNAEQDQKQLNDYSWMVNPDRMGQ